MTTVSSTTATTQNPSTSSAVTATTSTTDVKTNEKISEFQSYLQANIISSKETVVSEEELFAASIAQAVTTLKGKAATEEYTKELLKQKAALKKSGGNVPFEDCAKNALSSLVKSGTLTAEEGDKIYSQSFAAAQLDSNNNALFDRIGGKGDPTKAVSAIEAALLGARASLTGFEDGSQKYDSRKLNEQTLTLKDIAGTSATQANGTTLATTASGDVVSGAFTPTGTSFGGQILFKPVANSNGKLAVISPVNGADLVDSIELVDSAGNVIEKGHFTSRGDTGTDGAKYSFTQPGSSYPKNISVRINYTNGAVQTYAIPDPSKRYQ